MTTALARQSPPIATKMLVLDGAAKAYEERRATAALARWAIIVGSAYAIATAWPPPVWSWTLSSLLVSVSGAALLVPIQRPTTAWRGRVAVALTGLLGLGCLAIAFFQSSPLARIVAPNHLEPRLVSALERANQHYHTASWTSARWVAALVTLAIGLQLLEAARSWWRLDHGQRRTLVEPGAAGLRGLFFWLLDLPPGTWRHSLTNVKALAARLACVATFTFCTTNVAGVLLVQNSGALEATRKCLPQAAFTECFETHGRMAPAGILLGLSVWVFVLPRLGSWLERISRREAAESAAKMKASGGPVLFLRSFKYDQVMLEPPRRSFIERVLAPSREALSLDALLVTEFLHVGVPRALGDPAERNAFPPYGSVRTYVDSSIWKETVEPLAYEARAIVLVFDERILESSERVPQEKGVSWELSHVTQHPELLDKTVFVAAPSLAASGAEELRARAVAMIMEAAGVEAPRAGRPLLSISRRASHALVTSAITIDATTVLLALRAALPLESRPP